MATGTRDDLAALDLDEVGRTPRPRGPGRRSRRRRRLLTALLVGSLITATAWWFAAGSRPDGVAEPGPERFAAPALSAPPPARPQIGPRPTSGTTSPGTTSPGTTSPGTTSPGTTRPDAEPARDRSAPQVPTSDEGFLVAPGQGLPAGTGELRTFTVEVEPDTGVDLADFTVLVEETLRDPRSWSGDPDLALQRVADPAAAYLRVVLATPATVDRLCGQAGLDTNGFYSCFDGRRAVLNLDRWQGGAARFDADLDTYRRYLVNHEVGHGFGRGHVGCPTPGALAPVMMQQTKGTGACRPNSWPYPEVN